MQLKGLKKYIILCIVVLLLTSGSISIASGSIFTPYTNTVHTNYLPGDYYDILPVDGRLRSYKIHIPTAYDHTQPVPLVLVFHGSGYGANSWTTQNYVDIDEKADQEGFITVYPNGELLQLYRYYKHPIAFLWDIKAFIANSREWNRWDENNIDDVNFIRNLINNLQTKVNIDPSRIYITGISGGAMMTYRLGAELSDTIAAIAPVAGTIGGIGYMKEPHTDPSPYIISDPVHPVPVISLHGRQDISVPYEGGWKKVFEWNTDELWVYCVSVNESISFWIKNNNCNTKPKITYSEKQRIKTRSYKNPETNADVVLVTYLDGGHEWFDTPTYEHSATDLIWEFFKQHPKN